MGIQAEMGGRRTIKDAGGLHWVKVANHSRNRQVLRVDIDVGRQKNFEGRET
jgi:hypothetical protein